MINKSILEVFGSKSQDGDDMKELLQSLIDKFGKTYTMGESEAPSWTQTYTSQGGREQQQKLLVESLLSQIAPGEGTYESRSNILGKGGAEGTLTSAKGFARNRLQQDWNEINQSLTPEQTANASPTDIYALIEQIMKSKGVYK